MNDPDCTADSISISDRALVVGVRAGDETAAEQLYRRYAKRTIGLIRSKMGTRLNAIVEPDDIAQSVFMSIFRGVREGAYDAPPGNTLWSLVAVIAVNKTRRRARCSNAAKRSDRRNVPLDSVGDLDDTHSLDIADLKITLDETLQYLRPIDRTILLARIRGDEIEEIAESINRTGRTVERSLKRIREKLSDLLL